MFNLVKRYLDTTFGLEARFRTAFISGGILFAVEVFALLLSGYLEGTFYIEDGIGVFQTAIWIVVVGDWVLFLLLFKLTRELWSIPDAFPVIENEESEEYLENIKSDLLSRITLQGSSRNIIVILFTSVIGFYFFIDNYLRLRDAANVYHFELFDGSYHIIGFITVRFIYFTSWVFLLPYLTFVSLNTVVTIRRIFIDCFHSQKIKMYYNFSHPDQHGGFSFLSNINLYLLLCLIVLFAELLSEAYTMPVLTNSVAIMLVVTTVIFLFVTFWFMRPVETFLSDVKKEADSSLKKRVFNLDGGSIDDAIYLVKYNHIKNLNFSVATFWSNIIINGLRAFSIVGVAYKIANMHIM